MNVKSPDFGWKAVFEAVRGNGDNGNIAIDDVRISKGACPNVATCDFENQDLCEYQNSQNNDINWIVKSSNGYNLGPVYDHTLGTNLGRFALFSTLQSTKNSTGKFQIK